MDSIAIRYQAEALAIYLAKRRNLGASAWLDSKGFHPADRARVLLELEHVEERLA